MYDFRIGAGNAPCYAKRNYSKIGKNMRKTEEGKKDTHKKKTGSLRMIPLSKSGQRKHRNKE